VLDAALHIAAEQGLAGVTIGAIAERLAVTRPVVYACYPSRGEVLAALLQRESGRVLRSVLAMLPPQRTRGVEQQFVDGFRTFFTAVDEHPESWRIIFARDPDPVLSRAIASGREQIARQAGVVLRPLLERWGTPDLDRALPALVEVFLAIGESGATLLLDRDQHWTPDALADVIGRAAYRAMRHVR
jgi:AcrR family transcriptional regulator